MYSLIKKKKNMNILSLLLCRKPVYVFEISGRFDVGNLPSYVECDQFFKDRIQDISVYLH